MPLRLLIQNIPYIGASLDTLLSDTGNKWRGKRVQTLLTCLEKKINSIEQSDAEIISAMQQKVSTKEFYDLFMQVAQKSALSHRTGKI
jgi:cytochrome c-type biogenesis protein CcmH/NrfF